MAKWASCFWDCGIWRSILHSQSVQPIKCPVTLIPQMYKSLRGDWSPAKNEAYIHSQKQMVQWAVYVTAEFYACMLSGWLGCNFCTAYVRPNGGGTYTVLNQLTLVWGRLIQQLIHSSNWMGHGRSFHFFNIFLFSKINLIMTFYFQIDHTHPMCGKMFLLSAMLWERKQFATHWMCMIYLKIK